MKEINHTADRRERTMQSCLSLKGKLTSLTGVGKGLSILRPGYRQSEGKM